MLLQIQMSTTNNMEKSGLNKIVMSMFRSSFSSNTCCLTSRSITNNVKSPVFVSSHHHPLPPSPISVDFHSTRHATPKKEPKRNMRLTTKKLLRNGYGFTSCSSDNNQDNDLLFTSDEERRKRLKEDTETLFSSKSFSSDSSEFYNKTHNSCRKKNKKNKKKSWSTVQKPPPPLKTEEEEEEEELVSSKDISGKKSAMIIRNEGTAVVKNTSNPYAEFRSSVLEMMVENDICNSSSKELEHLMRCYLALNSRLHHPIIMQVFYDIWEDLCAHTSDAARLSLGGFNDHSF